MQPRSGDIVLTGGSSPKRAYELAAARAPTGAASTVWFTDERCVPPDHECSNFAMVDAALLSRLDRAAGGACGWRASSGPRRGAAAYEARSASGSATSRSWTSMLLGLGPDAHIASLFPGKPERHVTDRLVVGVPEAGMEPYVPRISLTLPAINAAAAQGLPRHRREQGRGGAARVRRHAGPDLAGGPRAAGRRRADRRTSTRGGRA